MQTTNNLASLLIAPINSYQSVLTLLALPRYASLLVLQPFTTRRSLAHAIVTSVLKNETIIETPEDVRGVLELCQVLIRDQLDTIPGKQVQTRRTPYHADREEMAEEQGCVARMVHLFRTDVLDAQFEVRYVLHSRMLVMNSLVFTSFIKRHEDTSKLVVNEYAIPIQRSSRTPSSCVGGINYVRKR